jgi:hypothetical protein
LYACRARSFVGIESNGMPQLGAVGVRWFGVALRDHCNEFLVAHAIEHFVE